MNRFTPKPAFCSARPHTGLFPTAIVAAFALILAACSIPYCPVAPEGTGGFSLSPRGSDGRTIVPGDMSVASYRLSGSGPGGAPLPAQDSTTGNFTATGLEPGDWTLRVEGSDADKNIVLTGETKVTIAAGKTTGATITLLPAASGTGTLSLSVAWTVLDRGVDEVIASLTPTGGAAIPLDFAVDYDKVTCEKTGLAPGSYLLKIELRCSGVRVARILTETVIVYNGKISQWAETLGDADFGPDYNVLYDANGAESGTPPTDSFRYATGMSVTAETGNDLAKASTAFVGWNTKADGSGSWYAPGAVFAMESADVTLYAMWNTVVYDGNGNTDGSVPVDTVVHAAGDTVTVLDKAGNFVKDGYVFAGWIDSVTKKTYQPGATFAKSAGINRLSAKWTKVYTITYDGNGSTGGTVPVDANTYANGKPFTISGNTGNLVKAGFIFAGWNTYASGNGTTYAVDSPGTMGTSNLFLYAKWTPLYTVTYDGNGNTGGTVPVDANTYLSGATYTLAGNMGNLEKTGYWFAGWNESAAGTGLQYAAGVPKTVYTNVVLYARWVPKVVAISADGDASYFVTETGDVWGTGSVLSPVNALSAVNNSRNLIRIRTDGARIRCFWDFELSTYNAFALDGSNLYGSGVNMAGSLGVGHTSAVTSATTIATGVSAIAGNYRDTMILKNDGSVVAAGENANGELATGNNTQISTLTTTQFTGGVKAIAMGWAHALILKDDGTLYAVGMNTEGELGTGDTTETVTPVEIATGVASIAAAGGHSFYITTAGDLYGCGDNDSGEIGNGTAGGYVTTPHLIAGNVAAVTAGESSTFFITTSGELLAMGSNSYGHLGTGDTTYRASPTSIIASGVRAVATGGFSGAHTIVLMTDGSVRAMGSNSDGEIGIGTGYTYTPIRILF
jgi:uncharacterized repeat protein (TIGR02543 family)